MTLPKKPAGDALAHNLAVIAEQATRIATLLEELVAALEPGEIATADVEAGDPDKPAPEPWRPVEGDRAVLHAVGVTGEGRKPVFVERLYESEGVEVAVVVDRHGAQYRVPSARLIPPPR